MAVEGPGPSSPQAKRGRKRSASTAGMDDEAHASKRQLFDVHASAGDAAHAAAMQQQQQQWQQYQQQQWQRRQAASTAAGTADPGGLHEETSAKEEEALEALLGFAAQGSGSNDSSAEDVAMTEAEEEAHDTRPQAVATMCIIS